jgi:hypothetical protein
MVLISNGTAHLLIIYNKLTLNYTLSIEILTLNVGPDKIYSIEIVE